MSRLVVAFLMLADGTSAAEITHVAQPVRAAVTIDSVGNTLAPPEAEIRHARTSTYQPQLLEVKSDGEAGGGDADEAEVESALEVHSTEVGQSSDEDRDVRHHRVHTKSSAPAALDEQMDNDGVRHHAKHGASAAASGGAGWDWSWLKSLKSMATPMLQALRESGDVDVRHHATVTGADAAKPAVEQSVAAPADADVRHHATVKGTATTKISDAKVELADADADVRHHATAAGSVAAKAKEEKVAAPPDADVRQHAQMKPKQVLVDSKGAAIVDGDVRHHAKHDQAADKQKPTATTKNAGEDGDVRVQKKIVPGDTAAAKKVTSGVDEPDVRQHSARGH